jgi:hypothetical protein
MEKNRQILLVILAFLFSGITMTVAGFPFSQKIDSIQIVFDNQQLVLPGESFRIGIVSYYKNGKIKNTTGTLGGSVWWWRYKVEVSGGKNNSGKISVNEQLMPARGKYVDIKIFPRKQPELAKEVFLPLNYETKITYQPTNQFDKSPGSQIQGEVISEFNDGTIRICKDLNNSYESGFFNFSAFGGSWENGRFIIDPDFRRIENHQAALIVNSLRNTLVSDTFAVRLDYKHKYSLQVSGNSGYSKPTGFARSSGFAGNSESDGQNGGFGSDGPDIGVWVDLYRDSLMNQDLLYVFAQNSLTGEEFSYLINPKGGNLEVRSIGGEGGSGGNGECGASGINGADGNIWIEKHLEQQVVKKPITRKVNKKEKKKVIDKDGKENEIEVNVEVEETVYVNEVIYVEVEEVKQGPGNDGTDGGDGGAGGLGGCGGYGGNITLYLTDDAWQYQHLFVANSVGGTGGKHGSGGSGGPGGSGGHGNPNGRNGFGGQSGSSAIGWADSGKSGQILIQHTEEFFNYTPKEQATGE